MTGTTTAGPHRTRVPGDSVVLRPTRWWDIEQMLTLETALFPLDAWTAGMFWSELAGMPGTRWFVTALHDDVVVGYAGLRVTRHDADVQTVAVSPDVQGAGVGTLLLRALLDVARARGVDEVFLEVEIGNEPARNLYVRHGFESLSRRRDYYGPGHDAEVMRLRLTDAPATSAAGVTA
jgi:ribosomal-protein-alanine N-acetyltransferase